jgi:nitroreductase
MEFSEVVRKRRMVRNYSPEPVEREVIERIVDLARHAPSAGFTQGQSFVVVTRPDLKKAVANVCGEELYVERGFDPWISTAPVLIVACTSEEAYHRRYRERDKIKPDGTEIEWPVPYWYMDIGYPIH